MFFSILLLQYCKKVTNYCTSFYSKIRQEAIGRGISGLPLDAILKYLADIAYVHKGNVEKHIRSGSLQQWAKDKFCHKDSSGAQSQAKPKSQTTLTQCATESAKRNYTRLFNTVFSLVMAEKPLADFPFAIKMPKREMAWNFCQAMIMNILVPYLSTCWQKLWDLISNQSCYYQIFSLLRWMVLRPEKQGIRKNLYIANLWFVGSLTFLYSTLLYFDSLPIQNTHLVLTGKP